MAGLRDLPAARCRGVARQIGRRDEGLSPADVKTTDAIATRVEQPDTRLAGHLELDHLAVGQRVRAESDCRRNAVVVGRKYEKAARRRIVRRARNGWRR